MRLELPSGVSKTVSLDRVKKACLPTSHATALKPSAPDQSHKFVPCHPEVTPRERPPSASSQLPVDSQNELPISPTNPVEPRYPLRSRTRRVRFNI